MAELGPVTCAGCGLLCDDVAVEASSDGARLVLDCPVGARWFSERIGVRDRSPAATIDGEATGVDRALARAAELLRGARRPLLHGFEAATVEDARAAVALADRLGALVRTGAGTGAPAVALRGASTATLGEIRDRSRLVVIWREDPETTHPRLLERLGFGDRGERRLAVVDDRDTATAARADLRLRWPGERDLDALTGLQVLRRGLALRPDDLTAELTGLTECLRAVPHAAFVYGEGLTAGDGGQRRALALHELVRSLCHERHAVSLELPGPHGAGSADAVLAWQSGYAGTVDFASGHPELVSAVRPLDEEVDVSLRVESRGAAEIAIGSLAPAPDVQVWIRTAPAGISAAGTVHRLDGVPLTLQAPEPDDAPTAAGVLARLLDEVRR